MKDKIEYYKRKMNKLRKKRDYHQERYYHYMKRMDDLESDTKYADLAVGKYVSIYSGSAMYYMKVDKWEKDIRGVTLKGKGFYSSRGLITIESYRLAWEEINKYTIITKEQFEQTFKEYVNNYINNFIGE